MSKKEKILVAMSGGIDSSVSAVLLQREGYEVIGLTMKMWGGDKENNDYIDDAKNLADKLGILHHVYDIQKEFDEFVICSFVNEYIEGKTPNPCVNCNPQMKWKSLLDKADELGCEDVATGHYVRKRFENNRYILMRGDDDLKDQSYMLWGLSQEQLRRTTFPLGSYSKDEIRKVALDNGYTELTKKKESFDICFIPDNDYRSFLKKRVKDFDEKFAGGNILSTDGEILGKHKGFPFYTIGQRKGLEVAVGYPIYVKEINAKDNTVILGKKEELLAKSMKISDFNLIKYDRIPENTELLTRIRYHDKGALSKIKKNDNTIFVEFNSEVSAVTPGQSAVFYDGDDVVGGGIIIE